MSGAGKSAGRLATAFLALVVLLIAAASIVRTLWPVWTRSECAGKTATDLVAIHFALEAYAEGHGAWPATLEALVQPDADGFRLLDCERVPKDVWGREYGYDRPDLLGARPRVYTLGADGLPGGRGDDGDLDEWSFLGDSR